MSRQSREDIEHELASVGRDGKEPKPNSTKISSAEPESDQYARFSSKRKAMITALASLGAFLPPISSTMIAAALPEVAGEFATSASVVNSSNALYLLAAGISPCFVGPLSSLYGRRPVLIGAAICYTAFSVGTALAPHIGALFAFRILTGFSSTALLTTGNTCVGDVYHPTQRGTAGGWILLGFELGPTLGPFIGGVMVTYKSWRTLFYFQAALGAFVTILYGALLPETAPYLGHQALANASLASRLHLTVRQLNPLRVIALFRFRPILAAGIGSGALMWNMYSLITPITYVLNPRFGITSPILSGLFFLAPGAGYILGALLGGRWADYTVKVYMRRRQGLRLPEDRLKSCLPFVGIVAPVSTILYGWSVQYEFGGIALPVVMLFLQAAAQLFGFLAINPYCLDVMQAHGRSADVIAGNYFIRYMFGAAGIAVALPVINSIGVGWLSTISALFLFLSTALLMLVTRVKS